MLQKQATVTTRGEGPCGNMLKFLLHFWNSCPSLQGGYNKCEEHDLCLGFLLSYQRAHQLKWGQINGVSSVFDHAAT